jgi:signal transduction histidine kinase
MLCADSQRERAKTMSSRIVLSGGESEDRRNAGISSAVHDLKAPLAIISGYVNLLIAGKLGEVNARQLSALRDISASSRRLEQRISQLLLFGSQQANRLTLSFERADLKASLTAIHECWLPSFQEKGVALECRLSHAPLTFEFDAQKVAQLVSNLLENALRFTPRGGNVSITAIPHFWERRSLAGRVAVERRLSRSNNPNAAKIIVADSGPGIPPENHQEIFDEFSSFPASGVPAGTGLGLTIARELAVAHGGKIWVESMIGCGSHFCVLLPFSPQRPSKNDSAASREPEPSYGLRETADAD